ncbi:acyl-CoA dehydrogenase family protein [Bradyrhizobium canariense]|uniref:Acyl-CoA dehydrogenase n=1 Tax=Bradyrhizobium canariense TaxID=255045 RepID=A0A1H1U5T0_9BRAD|nr:acyl-CoA dehydrogenase family protein [Bradyrhizobium canariense]SDS67239.1 acyl-CoA dehydrogenase [Bradyrhizobium canariense]
MDFELSGRSEQWRKKLQTFFDQEVLPRHRAWVDHVANHREAPPFMGDLQQKARAAGLWNLGLPELAADEPGTRLSNLEYAPLAEIMGRLFWASEVFNCQAPDVPNMIALQNCATSEQKQRWLRPLLEAKTRSAFGMTEPDVASSDATNIATRMIRDGDDYIITGRKWFITGAAHPRCSFLIVLGVTDPDAERTRRHSCIIVPMDSPGVRLVRSLRWMGCEDHVAPIGELAFDNVRVPRANLLGGEGEGFKVSQVRLGPARIHHCMRSIGLCELLIELMMVRSAERSAFGRTVIQYDTIQRWIAESRVELEQARLLAYRCAWRLDQSGHHGASSSIKTSSSIKNWRDVSLIKVAVPAMLQRIADRAMQVFGAMGGSDDTPIHQALAWGRLLRIGDGPDEVHLRQIFRMEPMPSWSVESSPYLAAHPS